MGLSFAPPPLWLLMIDKGYRFPLHTLNLMTEAPDDVAVRYALPVPEGRLYAAERWLRRAGHFGSLTVLRRVRHVLLLCEPFRAELSRAGADAGWIASMRHWQAVLTRTFQEHFLLALECEKAAERWAALEQELEGRWQRLWLWLRLAGVYVPGVPRALPRTLAERAVVLAQMERALTAALAPPPRDAALWQARPVLADLLRERERLLARREALAQERGRAADRGLVLRAALMGDLMRCGEVARLVLPSALCALFLFERLFPSHAKERRPSAARRPRAAGARRTKEAARPLRADVGHGAEGVPDPLAAAHPPR